MVGPDGSVGITTYYGLEVLGSNPGGRDFSHPSRPALGPTRPPVQWSRYIPGDTAAGT